MNLQSNFKLKDTFIVFIVVIIIIVIINTIFFKFITIFFTFLEDGNIFLVTFFLEVCSDYFSQVASCYRVCLSSDRGFDFLLMKNWTIARSFVGSYTPIIKLILWINWLHEGILKNDHY